MLTKHWRQWLRVVRLAVVGMWTKMPWPEALGYTLGGAWGILRMVCSPWDEELADERLVVCCNECPVYDAKLQTCGTPGEMEGGHPPTPRGCWCYLPFVAGARFKTCYARNRGFEFGWKR